MKKEELKNAILYIGKSKVSIASAMGYSLRGMHYLTSGERSIRPMHEVAIKLQIIEQYMGKRQWKIIEEHIAEVFSGKALK